MTRLVQLYVYFAPIRQFKAAVKSDYNVAGKLEHQKAEVIHILFFIEHFDYKQYTTF